MSVDDERRRLEALMMEGVITGYRYTTEGGVITEIEAVNLPQDSKRGEYDYE